MARSYVYLKVIFAIVLCWAGSAAAEAVEVGGEYHGRAVSLRVLEERVKGCVNGQECSTEVLRLAELRWLEGYVIDPITHDLILVGQVVNNSPPLHLEDFIVNYGFCKIKSFQCIKQTAHVEHVRTAEQTRNRRHACLIA